MYWYNQPQQARDLGEDGLRYLDEGPNGAYLHVRYAAAAAQLGDSDGAYRALSRGRDAREREYTDDMLEIGGEFAISLASHLRDIGTVLTDIDGADQEAVDELQHAVAAYGAGPGPGEQHWFAGKPLASIELASIHLRSGALDAAAATLIPSCRFLPPTAQVEVVHARRVRPRAISSWARPVTDIVPPAAPTIKGRIADRHGATTARGQGKVELRPWC